MPNWCSNKIVIKGDRSVLHSIKEVMNLMEDTDGLFEKLVGMTDWGCPDVMVNDCTFIFDDGLIQMTLDTEWVPPIDFCGKLSEKYGIEIHLEYFEVGVDISGAIDINCGKITSEQKYTYYHGLYLLDNEMFWEDVNNTISQMVQERKYHKIDEFVASLTFTNEKDRTTIDDMYEYVKNFINNKTT